MLWRKTQRQNTHRQGFTLIELLVVVGIVAVLMSLLLAAVMKAKSVGPRADTASRMAAIGNGIGQFKAQYNVNYIPAGGSLNTSTGAYGSGFRLRNSYTATTNPDLNSFEAQYIAQLFGGNVKLADLGNSQNFPGNDGSAPIILDSNQTLLFFLNGITSTGTSASGGPFQGFSRNTQQPFTPAQSMTEDRRRPLLDLNNKHYIFAASNGFPQLIDGWKHPFAYFVAYNGKPNYYGGVNPSTGGPSSPYMNSSSTYVNPSGFQIISAGEDGTWAPGGLWSNIPGDSDDQANFSNNLLGRGPQ